MIRNVKRQEWDDFMRFLERCYGFQPGWFTLHYPTIYDPDRTPLDCFHVIEKNGRIVAHAGLFPLRVMAEGVELVVGGIGGIGTLPEERGQGHMQELLRHLIVRMQELGMPLSALWGFRQRYAPFGYESAGERVSMEFTEHSFTKAGVAPDPAIREVTAEEAKSEIKPLHAGQLFRVLRSDWHPIGVRRPEVRLWIGAHGYLCGWTREDRLVVREVVSASGREPSLIMAAMRRNSLQKAQAAATVHDEERVARLLVPAESWTISPEGMFRINNCYALLKAFQPMLQRKAGALELRDFAFSIGVRYGNEVDVAGIHWQSGLLDVTRDKVAQHMEIECHAAIRLLLGGPPSGAGCLGGLSALLPLPISIPELDRV